MSDKKSRNPWIYLGSIPKQKIPVNRIFLLLYKVFLEHYGIAEEQIKCKTRKKELVYIRQIMCYWLKEYYEDHITLKRIGYELNRDHTTVIHSIEQYQNRLDTDADLPFKSNPGRTKIDYDIVDQKIHNYAHRN